MNRSFINRFYPMLLCCMLLLLAACSGRDEEPETPNEPETAESGDDFAAPINDDLDIDTTGPKIGEDVDPAAGGRSGQIEVTPEIVGDLKKTDLKVGDLFASAKSLEELVAQYPELAELMTNLDLSDRDNLSAVYEQMLILYKEEGLLGMQTFLDESGFMAAMGMDASYIDFVLAYENEGWDGAEDLARRRRLINQNDELRMILVLDTASSPDAESGAEALGATVLYTTDFEIEIGVPLEMLRDAENSEEALARLVALTKLPNVARVRVPRSGVTNQRILEGEGPDATSALEVHDSGITGDGIKVGIIDPGGFYAFQDLLGTRLPDSSQVFVMPGQDADYLNDRTGPHGTACAEIVHEMAPDATIYIAQAQSGPELAAAAQWMVDEGVDIINYSAGNIYMPPNNSTPASELVTLVNNEDVLWVNSSGNFAESHLIMEFTDEDGNGVHEFPNGDEYFAIAPFEGVPDFALGMSWDDAWGRAENDFDFFLLKLNDAGDDLELVDSSRELQDGARGSFPVEGIENYSDEELYYLAIVSDGATAGTTINLIGYNLEFQFSMPEYSVTVPGDSPDALTVGATFWSDDALEPYSSQGPTMDNRDKPEISAPAGVSSTVYGGPFYGTSASAPHVAGAAALALQANPEMGAFELRNYLITTSKDLGPSGFDLGFGHGRLDLNQLAENGSAPPPPPENTESGDSVGTVPIEVFYAYDVHNIEQNGQTGMVVETSLIVSQSDVFDGTTGSVQVQFTDDAGSPMNTLEAGWTVRAGEAFLPLVEQFIAYDDFNLTNGYHDLQYTVSVLDDSGNLLSQVDPVDFFIEISGEESTTNGSVSIYDVEVVQNVTSQGEDGIGIKMMVDIVGRNGMETQIIGFFFQDTSSEPPLKDFNDRYTTPAGTVATWATVTPSSDNETREVRMFIPNSEMHLAKDARYALKVAFLALGEPDWETELGAADWVRFRVDTGTW